MSTTIGKQLRARLRDAIGQEQTSIDANHEAGSVSVDIERCERYAIGVRGISVRPAEADSDIGGIAERISDKVDVIDPLRVVEIETEEQQAILRSAEPEADEEGVTYWEATVTPDETTLHRYHKTHAEPDRTVVVEPLTHGAIGELADQIMDALTGDKE